MNCDLLIGVLTAMPCNRFPHLHVPSFSGIQSKLDVCQCMNLYQVT